MKWLSDRKDERWKGEEKPSKIRVKAKKIDMGRQARDKEKGIWYLRSPAGRGFTLVGFFVLYLLIRSEWRSPAERLP